MKGRKKTISGMFLRYVLLLGLGAVLLAGGLFLLLLGLFAFGGILPANYAEVWLTEQEAEIRKAGTDAGDLIPEGCTYGIYESDGRWVAGSFSGQESRDALEHYAKERVYGSESSYYRFIDMEDGRICIVRYWLKARYSDGRLNALLPAPEAFGIILFSFFFLTEALLLSRRFAGELERELKKLSAVTDKIAANDLTFEAVPSKIREINTVMQSLAHMKDALQDSLEKQWDLERLKQEQLAALTHDIKTPLTVIRGNTELLAEGSLGREEQECADYVLANVGEIEQYLESMRCVLDGTGRKTEAERVSIDWLEERLCETVKQVATAEKLPVSFGVCPVAGRLRCCVEDLLRAWKNIVSNGAEHTEPSKGLEILIGPKEKENRLYLVASVLDWGPGFSKKDLRHADEEFYSADVSRHDRSHQGLGLTIAKRFMEQQGGFLEYGNRADGQGAQVSLWMRI